MFFSSLENRCILNCFCANDYFSSLALHWSLRITLSFYCVREQNYSFSFIQKLFIASMNYYSMQRWALTDRQSVCLPQLDNLSWSYTYAGIVLKFARSSRGLENSTMVKQGQKPGQKTGISIQNTSTLTRGQMKIRVFTGLAGALQNAHRRKVRNFSFCWMFAFIRTVHQGVYIFVHFTFEEELV